MKPLEQRRWFALTSLAVSVVLTYGLWRASALPLVWTSSAVFLLAAVGLNGGVNKFLALVVIRAKPGLGAVG